MTVASDTNDRLATYMSRFKTQQDKQALRINQLKMPCFTLSAAYHYLFVMCKSNARERNSKKVPMAMAMKTLLFKGRRRLH